MGSGEVTKAFKGLRQGDDVSLFLFSIAMKYLSRCLHELKDFKFHLLTLITFCQSGC